MSALVFAVGANALSYDRSTTLTIQNMTNTQLTTSQCRTTSGKFNTALPSSIPPSGQMTVQTVNTDLLTGCSGLIILQPNHASGFIVVQFDNPYIGSNSYKYSAPAGFDCFAIKGDSGHDGSGNDAYLTIRIEGKVATSPARVPDVSLPVNGPGVVRGRVLWPASYGNPIMPSPAKGVQAARIASVWEFFQFSISQPTKFHPYAAANSLTATYYQGKFGEFIDPQKTGVLSFGPLQGAPPGFSGFEFTISNLPPDIPVDLSVGPIVGTTWKAAKPVQASGNPSFHLVAKDGVAQLTPQMLDIAGFDFTVVGDWPDPNAPIHTMVRSSSGGSKSKAEFGTLTSEAVAALTAKQAVPVGTLKRG